MSEQQKRTRSFYLTEEAYRLLNRLSESWKISSNQATERAIRQAYDEVVEESTESEQVYDEALVEDLRDQVGYLREQLRTRDEEIRRRDHILAASLERIPAILPKSGESEATGGDLRASEEGSRGTGQGKSSDKAWWQLWRQ